MHYLAVDHSLWVKTAWTPPTLATNVTVVVQQGSQTLQDAARDALADRHEDVHALAPEVASRRHGADRAGAGDLVGGQRAEDDQRAAPVARSGRDE